MKASALLAVAAALVLSRGFAAEATGARTSIDGQSVGAAFRALSSKRIYFGHNSVGGQLLQGVRALGNAHPADAPAIRNVGEPLTGGSWAHGGIGTNGNPRSKIAGFAASVRSMPPVDAALMKLCYVDLGEGPNRPDPRALFAEYAETVAQLERERPATRFVHVTVPLVAGDCGGNAVRETYNELLRSRYAEERIFDLARLESTDADGRRCTCAPGNRTPALCPAWDSGDGGHLKDSAATVLAAKLVPFLASVR